MTAYVCTRWYRAPELLFRATAYSAKVPGVVAPAVLAKQAPR